jgi:hypothetical protein
MMKSEKTPRIPPYVGPMVLLTDVIAAAAIWFFREDLLGPDMDTIAAALGIFFIMGGMVGFMIFKNLSRKVL